MANSQARDGRLSLAFIGGDPAKATSVAIGDFIVVTAKGTSTVFSDYDLNRPFFAMKAFTPATGDEVYKIPLYFLGQATGKSLSHSKNTTDVTMDYDEATNNVTDGIVSSSGSISGMFITEKIVTDADTGVNILKSRFKTLVQIGSTGTVTKKEAATTKKDILVICWNLRNAKAGDMLDIDIVPALITGLNIGGEYGSSQSFDIDFTGNASDENNFMGSELQLEATAALLSTFKTARPATA